MKYKDYMNCMDMLPPVILILNMDIMEHYKLVVSITMVLRDVHHRVNTDIMDILKDRRTKDNT